MATKKKTPAKSTTKRKPGRPPKARPERTKRPRGTLTGEVLAGFSVGKDRTINVDPKYDWDTICDGNVRVFRRGVDFHSKPESWKSQCYTVAARRGKVVDIRPVKGESGVINAFEVQFRDKLPPAALLEAPPAASLQDLEQLEAVMHLDLPIEAAPDWAKSMDVEATPDFSDVTPWDEADEDTELEDPLGGILD